MVEPSLRERVQHASVAAKLLPVLLAPLVVAAVTALATSYVTVREIRVVLEERERAYAMREEAQNQRLALLERYIIEHLVEEAKQRRENVR
jgi:hypothetical protein